jgi:flagellar biogenesis protein FliO
VTLLQQSAGSAIAVPYVVDLLRTLVALCGVCLLVWIGARWLSQRGFGVAQPGPAASLRVLRRIALEPRKHLYVVQVGTRVLLVGTGEGGPPTLLVELDAASLSAEDEAAAVKGPRNA